MASLARTGVLSGVAVLVRLASALALNKILAVYVGPAGYALVGQMQSMTSILAGLTAGAFSSGVTKGTAEHFDDYSRQRSIWRTAARLSLWTTFAAVVLLLAAREPLARWLFGRNDLSNAIYWLAIALPAMSVSALLLAIVNGKKEVYAYVVIGVMGSGLSVVATAALAGAFGLPGALIAIAIGPAVPILGAALVIRRKSWFRVRYLWGPIDSTSARELSRYALMALTTAVCTPIAHLLIRDHLSQGFGSVSAGYWHALTKVSEIYLAVITMMLTLYFLPRIAEIRHRSELAKEIAKVYRYTLPPAALAAACIYLFRETLVLWLFTPEFSPMGGLFGWQLAGDVVKAASWVLGCVLLGRAATSAFISTELVFSALWVLLTWALTPRFGVEGVVMAYFMNYVLYLIATAFLVKRLMRAQFASG